MSSGAGVFGLQPVTVVCGLGAEGLHVTAYASVAAWRQRRAPTWRTVHPERLMSRGWEPPVHGGLMRTFTADGRPSPYHDVIPPRADGEPFDWHRLLDLTLSPASSPAALCVEG